MIRAVFAALASEQFKPPAIRAPIRSHRKALAFEIQSEAEKVELDPKDEFAFRTPRVPDGLRE
jgi:hypothetical protein